MKAGFYTGTRPGLIGLGNQAIRLRLKGNASHCEAVFQPGDGVDHLMPDRTCEPVDDALWCASAVGAERMPAWSPRRPGRLGGVRFKRIVLDEHWELLDPLCDPLPVAQRFFDMQGALYDWQYIFGFVAWPIPQRDEREACSESLAAALGFPQPWRFDPMALKCALTWRLAQKGLRRD